MHLRLYRGLGSLLLSLVCCTVMLSGCGGVVYRVDPQTRESTVIRRFSHQEDLIYESIDSSLADERAGKRPSGGMKTWRQYWRASILAWRRHVHPQYEEYFFRRRAQIGLTSIERPE
jgi:hypothetical protein